MSTSPDLGIPYISGQQAQPEITHNEAIALLQAVLNGVIDRGTNTPPGSPTEGDAYIIGDTPTGAWAGRADAIAVFAGTAWLFVPGNDSAGDPIAMGARQEGLRVWVRDEDATYVWNGTIWTTATPLNNFSGSAAPTVNDDETLGYSAGSKWWVHTVASPPVPIEVYLCTDATEGAAVWEQITVDASDLGTMAVQDADDVDITGGSAALEAFSVGTEAGKASILYLTNQARDITIPALGGNRTLAFIDQSQAFTATQNFATINSTNDFTITGTSSRSVNISAPAGFNKSFVFQTSGQLRWLFRTNDAAESGSNAGSGFELVARADDSSAIDIPLTITRASGGAMVFGGDTGRVARFTGDVDPALTESQDIGSVDLEWDNLFVQNAVTVSDERTKNIIGEMDDEQIDNFLTALDAIWFSKKDIEVVVTPAKAARTERRQVTDTVQEEKVSFEVVDGKAVRKVETVETEKPVFELLPVVDEDGKPVMVEVSPATPAVLDRDGRVVKEAKEAVPQQASYRVPVMEDVEIPAEEEVRKTITHGRPHSGFTAQQVKAAMTEAGIEDWAGYAYDEETDKHFLRHNEFIGVLVKGYQILKAKVNL